MARIMSIIGVLFVLVGAVALGIALGRFEKAKAAAPDGTAVQSDTGLVGSAVALLGSGTALIAVSA